VRVRKAGLVENGRREREREGGEKRGGFGLQERLD